MNPNENQNKMKTANLVIIIIVAVVVLWVFSKNLIAPSVPDVAPISENKSNIPSVRIKESHASSITKTIDIYGVTQSFRTVELKSEIEGRITEIKAIEGEFINKGDVIAELDKKDMEAKRNKAEAVLELRQIEYNAAKSLARTGHQSDSKVAEAMANLASAKADLKAVNISIDNSTIKAPFDAVIEEIPAEEGDVVRIRETVIARLVDNIAYVVTGEVPENKIGTLKLGSDGFAVLANGIEAKGKVTYVAGIADKLTRTFRVEVTIYDGGGNIPLGMTAEIKIPTETVKAHLVSSSNFSLNEEGDVGIKILSDDDIVKFQKVEIVEEDPDGMWVTGLPDKADIITVGQAFLRDGDKAKIASGSL